ncbi:hypothetical protein EDC56_0241 [Sinobacterium caligoides]|uniref:Uncharacterized protein n=2 Tax=Sinobacterium caligoides TaxID=933926 RepID=A0A3N2DY31_9GAMM|nr:hypothetical protein EDC56_0241 [Sinobacterium caligoides]
MIQSINGDIDTFGDIHFKNSQETIADEFFTLINRRGIVTIKGVDSKTFLQGQLTCDVQAINQEKLCSGGYCTPKGRVIGNFWLSQWHDEHLCMASDSGGAAALIKQLSKYIVFSKAEAALDSDTACIGIQTNKIASVCGTLFEQLPAGPEQQVINGDLKLLQLNEQGLYELWTPADKLSEIWGILNDKLHLANSSHWDRAIIASGFATVDANTTELLIPQHLNMQLNGGINFTKGCYTGQEVVARMQYRGKLKRHMYRVSAPSLPDSGAPLFGTDGEQSIGNMLQSCRSGEQQEGLACITVAAVAADAVFDQPAGQQRQQLKLLPLPYDIPADD